MYIEKPSINGGIDVFENDIYWFHLTSDKVIVREKPLPNSFAEYSSMKSPILKKKYDELLKEIEKKFPT